MKITIKDIAREAGVSVATVSNVVNNTGRVSEDTVRRIRQIIKEKNFVPSTLARGLKNKKSDLISVIVPYLKRGTFEENPFFWQLISGVEMGTKNREFNVMLTGVDNDNDLSFVNKHNVDGLIVVGINAESELYKSIMRLKIPTVFMDSYIDNPEVYQVCNDDLLGGYLGTKHLISQGHTMIMLVVGSLSNRGVDYQRLLGYKQALAEAGLAYDESLILKDAGSMLGGYHAAQKIFSLKNEKITAAFVLSDIGAMGLIKGLNEMGIKVPEDISVVGYDDIFYTEFMIPSLTTIRQDIYKKGKIAAGLLLAQINEEPSPEKNILLPVELKVRESTAKI